MRTVFFCIIFITLSTHSYAIKNITISGKVSSKGAFFVKIFEPINGYYNQASVQINSNSFKETKDSFFYSFAPLNSAPCFFSIGITNTSNNTLLNKANFLLCPGDSTYISIEPENNNYDWIKFSGDNAAGNNLFEKINFEPAEKFSDLFVLIDRLPNQKEDFLKNIDGILGKFYSGFEVLNEKKDISPLYLESMKKSFSMSFFSVIISQFMYPYAVGKRTSKSFRDSIVENLFHRLNPLNIETKPLYNSFIYINNYYLYQVYKQKKLAFANLIDKDSTIDFHGKKYVINGSFIHYLFIKDNEIKEFLWTIELLGHFQMTPGFFDEKIINQFAALFPNSQYLGLIKKDFEKTSKIKEIEYTANVPIVVADTLSNFSKVDSILAKFREHVVYVDLWASWCGPCVASFAYNKSIDSFLLKNKIERLYISLDENKLQWRKAIDKYQLGGFHVLANNYLIKDIRKLLSLKEGISIAIPHYLIYNKEGRLIFKDAESPMNDGQLFDELKKALNQ